MTEVKVLTLYHDGSTVLYLACFVGCSENLLPRFPVVSILEELCLFPDEWKLVRPTWCCCLSSVRRVTL